MMHLNKLGCTFIEWCWLYIVIAEYSLSLRPKISVRLAFKICPTKIVLLACSGIHLIKRNAYSKKKKQCQISRKNCIDKRMEPIKCLVDATFSSSNANAFIEDLENQTNNTVRNHNSYN